MLAIPELGHPVLINPSMSEFQSAVPRSLAARRRGTKLDAQVGQSGSFQQSVQGKQPQRNPTGLFSLRKRIETISNMRGGDGSTGKSVGPIARVLLLLLLLAIYIHNQWSRNSIIYAVNFAVPPSPAAAREYINIDLGFDASQYGLMASYGFTLLYTLLSLIAGRVADTTHKGRTLAFACATWSTALLLQGLVCTGFYSALACRIVQGVAMAFTGPQAMSLLADAFPQERLATATSIYTSGVYFGSALASLSILLNSMLGWRSSFMLLGAAGCGLAAAVALGVDDSQAEVRARKGQEERELLAQGEGEGEGEGGEHSGDPAALDQTSQPGPQNGEAGVVGGAARLVRESVGAMGRVVATREVQWAVAAGAVRFSAGYGIGVWSAPMFRERFPGSQAAFAGVNAAIIAAGGFVSSVGGGVLSDRLGGGRARLLVPAVGCFLAVPAIALAATASSFHAAMVFLFGHYLVAECWIGPFVSFLTSAVPKEVRGSAQGLVSVLTLVGNLAPLLIGYLYSKAGVALGSAFLWCVCSSYLLAGSLFVTAALKLGAPEARTPAEEEALAGVQGGPSEETAASEGGNAGGEAEEGVDGGEKR